MTLNDLQRAALVMFAAKEAGETGNLMAMKAVCFVMRNRVRAGWHDGNWLTCIEAAADVEGNEPQPPRRLDLNSRALQMLARDVDGIFYGTMSDPLEDALGDPARRGSRPALYWQFMNRPAGKWFEQHILSDRANHAIRARLHPMVFYE